MMETTMPPPKPKTDKIPIHMLYERELMKEIEDFRYKNRFPTRVETITALVRLGLDAAKKPKTARTP